MSYTLIIQTQNAHNNLLGTMYLKQEDVVAHEYTKEGVLITTDCHHKREVFYPWSSDGGVICVIKNNTDD